MRKPSAVNRTIRICMVLYNSLPHDPRVIKEVRVLRDAGYDVSVLDVDLGLERRSSPRGVGRHTVLRINFLKRTSIGGLLLFWLACLKHLFKNRRSIDVVHAHDLTGLPPAFFISVLCPRIRLLYDSHENFPEAAKDELSYFHYVLFLGLELICSVRIGWLISVSPSCLRTLSHRIRANPSLLMNVPDLDRIRRQLGRIPKWEGLQDDEVVRIACPSVIRPRRGFEKLPKAAESLSASGMAHFKFFVIGDGPLLPELRKTIEERELEQHFHFTGRVGFEDVLRIIVECDLALAIYEEGWNNDSGLSNKIFEYMMVGIPFIYSRLKQSMPFLEMVGAYTLENPVTGEDIANAVLALHDDDTRMIEMAKKGPPLIASRFNWAKESQRLLRVYQSIRREMFD
jgi:glycosyltransferase involved in cell wall biosynthesis